MPTSAVTSSVPASEQHRGNPPAENGNKPVFESWGRYPKYPAKIVPMNWQQEFPGNIEGLHSGALPVGMGRSYGDSCLLKDGKPDRHDRDETFARL